MAADPDPRQGGEAMRRSRLRQALSVAAGQDLQEASAGLGGGSLAALRFVLQQLGSERQLPDQDGELVALLDRHAIPHRRVALPDLRARSWRTLLAWQAGAQTSPAEPPLVLLHQGGKPWVWQRGRLRPLAQREELAPEAIELFRPIPASGIEGWPLLRFAFAGEGVLLRLVLFSALLNSLFSLGLPGLSVVLVSLILPQSDRGLILESAWAALLLVGAIALAQWLLAAFRVRLESTVALRMEGGIWSHLLQLPFAFFQRLGSADLTDRVAAIRRMRDLIARGGLSAVLGLVLSLASLMLMFLLFPQLAPPAVLSSLLAATAIAAVVLPSIRLERPLQQLTAECQGFALQAVQGLAAIRVAGDEPFVLQQWLRRVVRISELQSAGESLGLWVELLARLIVPLGTLLVFAVLVGGDMAAGRNADVDGSALNQLVASFVAFQAAFLVFSEQITATAIQLGLSAGRLLVLWERASLVFATPTESLTAAAQDEPELQGAFELQRVSAGYGEGGRAILRDISLRIETGCHLAISGPSGSGKSTLMRLLLGLVEPTAGVVLVDGQPLARQSLHRLRRQMAVVLQDAPLPTGTVASVVAGGQPLPPEDLWEALELACLADEVRAMPAGLETDIGEGGASISGGQRQRLCLARALARRPRVLLLDEATSALDAPTQERITRALEGLSMTRVVIAHRLATVRHADRIVVIEDGGIREDGDYDSLMALEGGYLRSRVLAGRRFPSQRGA